MKKNVKDYKPNTNNNLNSKSKGSNSMKKNRRITAILTAACLTMPLACTAVVPFSAVAAGTNSITIDSSKTNSDIAAYQVFAGTYENSTLVVTGWGSGINASAFITALQASTVFGTTNPFSAITYNGASPEISAVAVADIIGGFTDNSEEANEVARLAIQNVSGSGTAATSGTKKIENLEDGYYVVKDKVKEGTEGTVNEAWTLGLLQVAGGNVEVAPKTSYPTVKKQVKENNGGWGSVADYNCGDAVPFRITATLPSDIDLYESYFLQFCDTLSENFTAPTDADFTLKIGADEEHTVTVKEDSDKWQISSLSVIIRDLKGLEDTSGNAISISSSDKVFVEYSAVLNSASVNSPEGSSNIANLVYSNDPNFPTTNPEKTGTTPNSMVKVYTYNLAIQKIDGVTKEKLEGAKFKIQNSDGEWAKKNTSTEEGAAPILWVTSDSDATEFVTTDDGSIKDLKGIDAGTYTITETAPPSEEYNPLTSPITVKIIPTYDDTELTELKYQIGEGAATTENVTGNTVTVEIKNNKGKTLPTTGGIGTKIFYIVGGMLVIGSGAALVIRKRIGKDEE